MISIVKHINAFSTSNTYILTNGEYETVWLIDPGDSDYIIKWLYEHSKSLEGIFITHSHIDHIYGINDLQNLFPSVKIYASFEGKTGMLSSKLNLSFYHEKPYIVKRDDIIVIQDGYEFTLWDGIKLKAHFTPGHNMESMSFQIGQNLFTGDALLPGVKVFTKFHGGNKLISQNTIRKILADFPPEQIIWPGHGQESLLKNIKIIL